jgi:hypothetical protein
MPSEKLHLQNLLEEVNFHFFEFRVVQEKCSNVFELEKIWQDHLYLMSKGCYSTIFQKAFACMYRSSSLTSI